MNDGKVPELIDAVSQLYEAVCRLCYPDSATDPALNNCWEILCHLRSAKEAKQPAPAMTPDLELERNRRIYYQDLVYEACNAFDRWLGNRTGSGICCGTYEEPSDGFTKAIEQVSVRFRAAIFGPEDKKPAQPPAMTEPQKDDFASRLVQEFHGSAVGAVGIERTELEKGIREAIAHGHQSQLAELRERASRLISRSIESGYYSENSRLVLDDFANQLLNGGANGTG